MNGDFNSVTHTSPFFSKNALATATEYTLKRRKELQAFYIMVGLKSIIIQQRMQFVQPLPYQTCRFINNLIYSRNTCLGRSLFKRYLPNKPAIRKSPDSWPLVMLIVRCAYFFGSKSNFEVL